MAIIARRYVDLEARAAFASALNDAGETPLHVIARCAGDPNLIVRHRTRRSGPEYDARVA